MGFLAASSTRGNLWSNDNNGYCKHHVCLGRGKAPRSAEIIGEKCESRSSLDLKSKESLYDQLNKT